MTLTLETTASLTLMGAAPSGSAKGVAGGRLAELAQDEPAAWDWQVDMACS
jgi:hypothetical protein